MFPLFNSNILRDLRFINLIQHIRKIGNFACSSRFYDRGYLRSIDHFENLTHNIVYFSIKFSFRGTAGRVGTADFF